MSRPEVIIDLSISLTKKQYDHYTGLCAQARYNTLRAYLRNVIKDSLVNLEWVVSEINTIRKIPSKSNWFNPSQYRRYTRLVDKKDWNGLQRLCEEIGHAPDAECPACKLIRLREEEVASHE